MFTINIISTPCNYLGQIDRLRIQTNAHSNRGDFRVAKQYIYGVAYLHISYARQLRNWSICSQETPGGGNWNLEPRIVCVCMCVCVWMMQ